jgi:hypothetical protein
MPHHPRGIDKVHEIRNEPEDREINAVTREQLAPPAHEAHNAHRSADVERQLLDVDLPVGKRHHKEIKHKDRKCNVTERIRDLQLCFDTFVSRVKKCLDKDDGKKNYKQDMPDPETLKQDFTLSVRKY